MISCTLPAGNPEVILIASGSEVSLVVDAHETLRAEGIRSQGIVDALLDIFDRQTREYRDSVPQAALHRIAAR